MKLNGIKILCILKTNLYPQRPDLGSWQNVSMSEVFSSPVFNSHSVAWWITN